MNNKLKKPDVALKNRIAIAAKVVKTMEAAGVKGTKGGIGELWCPVNVKLSADTAFKMNIKVNWDRSILQMLKLPDLTQGEIDEAAAILVAEIYDLNTQFQQSLKQVNNLVLEESKRYDDRQIVKIYQDLTIQSFFPTFTNAKLYSTPDNAVKKILAFLEKTFPEIHEQVAAQIA